MTKSLPSFLPTELPRVAGRRSWSISCWVGSFGADLWKLEATPGLKGEAAETASQLYCYLSNRPKVHSDAPAGTLTRFGSPARRAYTPPMPLMTVTYCLPPL